MIWKYDSVNKDIPKPMQRALPYSVKASRNSVMNTRNYNETTQHVKDEVINIPQKSLFIYQVLECFFCNGIYIFIKT